MARNRSPSEVLKRGYSDEELAHIYELGRFLLENGDMRRAEIIFTGLTEVAGDFAPAWLGMCCVHMQKNEADLAATAAQQALKADPETIVGLLFLICCQLSARDLNAAGTYLGEVGDKIEGGLVKDPNIIRFYKVQLARYQNR